MTIKLLSINNTRELNPLLGNAIIKNFGNKIIWLLWGKVYKIIIIPLGTVLGSFSSMMVLLFRGHQFNLLDEEFKNDAKCGALKFQIAFWALRPTSSNENHKWNRQRTYHQSHRGKEQNYISPWIIIIIRTQAKLIMDLVLVTLSLSVTEACSRPSSTCVPVGE
jgi:hypothetical protein